MSAIRRVTVDLACTLADLEGFCATARRDGASGATLVTLAEVAPFIKKYRLQIICPPNTPKETR